MRTNASFKVISFGTTLKGTFDHLLPKDRFRAPTEAVPNAIKMGYSVLRGLFTVRGIGAL